MVDPIFDAEALAVTAFLGREVFKKTSRPPAAGFESSRLLLTRWDDSMRKVMAAVGSLIFFILAPGFVAGVVPWSLTRWRLKEPLAPWLPFQAFGALLIVCGAAVLLHAFTRFVMEGTGTPAPVAPPTHLVVGGLYQHVRNPMYLAVLAIIVGQAFALGQLRLLFYAGGVFALFAAFVHGYEEPALRRRFGPEYDLYCREVPAWWPRLRRRRSCSSGSG